MTACYSIHVGTLCLHYRQWRSVRIKQYIVCISHTALIRHTLHLYLYSGLTRNDFSHLFCYRPACFVKQQVDIQFSGFRFREVVYNRPGFHCCRLCIGTFSHRLRQGISRLRGSGLCLVGLRNNGKRTRFCRLRNQLFVKVRQCINHLPSQHDRTHNVIKVQHGKERFTSSHKSVIGVCCIVSDFAYIVDAFHQVFAIYKCREAFIGGERKQRSTFSYLPPLQAVNGLNHCFQRQPCLLCRNHRISRLKILCYGTITVDCF